MARYCRGPHRRAATAFPEAMTAAVPYKIHTVLTDTMLTDTVLTNNGIRHVLLPRYRSGPTASCGSHMFGMRCEESGIGHRQKKVRHPWTNGQAERMNRTIKDAAVKRFCYDSHAQLRTRLDDFPAACNFVQRLKTLKGLRPYEYICTNTSAKSGLPGQKNSILTRPIRYRD